MLFGNRTTKSILSLAAAIWLGLSCMLSACGEVPADSVSEADETAAVESGETVEFDETDSPTASAKKGTYTAPTLMLSEYKGEIAEEIDEVQMDDSGLEKGYIGFSAKADNDLVLQIVKDEEKYRYALNPDGTPSIFPLQMGDGTYEFFVCRRIEGKSYAVLAKGTLEVELDDEFQPFLRPSDYVSYDRRSEVVKKGKELAKGAGTAVDVVKAVYDYVTKNVKYDTEKAKKADTDIPALPDETLKTGEGICLDYAALAAALLRSQGIPTKMIYGYVGEDDLYHAWNMFYTKETGWVTVKFNVNKKNAWYRLDLTFSAGGAPAEFVGDGSNYRDLHTY